MIQAPQVQYIPAQCQMPVNYQQQGAFQQPVQYQQAPGYLYNYPTASCYAQPAAKSQFNGVNIEIINPQGQALAPQGMQAAMPVQQTPMMPAQFMPVQQQAPMMPAQFMPVQQQPITMPTQYMPVQQPITMPAEYMPVQKPITMPAQFVPVQQPVTMPASQAIIQAPNGAILTDAPQAAVPVVPQPQIVAPQVVPATPVVEQPATATATATATTTAATPVVANASIDPKSFAGKLQTVDLDSQRKAIEEVAELVKNNETAGPILLDTQIFDALVGIINTDTTTLAGPTPEIIELRNKPQDQLSASDKAKATMPTPLEKAEINKQYAIYTIAYMQERLNNELEKRNGQTLELKDLPCIETVVNTVKSNPNPRLRIGAIAALSHIAKPQYSADLQKVFELAQADEDVNVKEAAAKAAQSLK